MNLPKLLQLPVDAMLKARPMRVMVIMRSFLKIRREIVLRSVTGPGNGAHDFKGKAFYPCFTFPLDVMAICDTNSSVTGTFWLESRLRQNVRSSSLVTGVPEEPFRN